MWYIIFGVLFILSVSLALILIFKPIIKDKKIRNNIINSDPLTQHYCFLLNYSQHEIIIQLSIPNIKDKLKYTFNINSLIITFSDFDVTIDYQLSFYTIENRTYLKVSRIKYLHSKSNIPFMINSFFINKIGATPVDYNFFESLICSNNK